MFTHLLSVQLSYTAVPSHLGNLIETVSWSQSYVMVSLYLVYHISIIGEWFVENTHMTQFWPIRFKLVCWAEILRELFF